jgi:predicted Holliday junction resolvase-like endonuclease
MIYALLIFILIIIILTVIIILSIKKNKSLRYKLKLAEDEIKQMEANARHYTKIIKKLNIKGKESEKVKENIDYARGVDLAKLANSL